MNINHFQNFHISNHRNLYALLIAILALSGCAETVKESNHTPQYCLDDFMKGKITIDTAFSAPVTEALTLTGKVEYNPDKVIPFVSLFGGVITNTYFTLGQEVKKGQLLAEIKSSELIELLAQQRSLQSKVQVAQRAFESTSRLYQDQVASQSDLVQAQSNLEVLKAALENIDAQLNLFEASSEKGIFKIKAPEGGIVIQKNIVPGMQISAEGDPLFTISDLNEVWIMANVYPGNMAYIKENMKAEIQSLAYPQEVFSGKINAIAHVMDDEERVLKARIVMNNANNKLMPGMLVDVTVEKVLGTSAVAVPTQALIFDHNQYFLLVHNNDCEIEVRTVIPTHQNTQLVFLDKHLIDGERVISKNHLLIYNHLKALN